MKSSFGVLKLKMKSSFQFKNNQKILTKFENSNECILTFAILSKVSQENLMKFYNFVKKLNIKNIVQEMYLTFQNHLKKWY